MRKDQRKSELNGRVTRFFEIETNPILEPMDAASKIVAFPGSPAPAPKRWEKAEKGITDMRSDLVEEASKVIKDPPLLINVVSRRVKQLNLGRKPLVEVDHRMGNADIALKEIIEGKIAPEESK